MFCLLFCCCSTDTLNFQWNNTKQYGLIERLVPSSPLTTWSFIWMHKDFFFIAATPVVKVFLTLVARRMDSWETPSRPAMEPDKTVAPATRLMHNELMIFLKDNQYLALKFIIHWRNISSNKPTKIYSSCMCDAYFWESCKRLVALVKAGFCLA